MHLSVFANDRVIFDELIKSIYGQRRRCRRIVWSISEFSLLGSIVLIGDLQSSILCLMMTSPMNREVVSRFDQVDVLRSFSILGVVLFHTSPSYHLLDTLCLGELTMSSSGMEETRSPYSSQSLAFINLHTTFWSSQPNCANEVLRSPFR
jgi:hypothetical protein